MTKLNGWKLCCAVLLFGAATATVAPAQIFTNLANFDGTDGDASYVSPVQGTDGNFYGTTYYGGAGDVGSVFEVTSAGALTTVYSFCTSCPSGYYSWAPLLLANDGNFYGTAYSSGNNQGTVFKITPSGAITTLHSFVWLDGAKPMSGLIQGIDGDFYGTTNFGGSYSLGTVFKISPQGVETVLYSFCASGVPCSDGQSPQGALVQDAAGNIYGTTAFGGLAIANAGTVFKITPAGKFTTLYRFCSENGCFDGAYPYGGLVQASDGNFYGTTYIGGSTNDGTIFKITAAGKLTNLHSFDLTDGALPAGSLTQGTDGSLYGTTSNGGTGNCSSSFGPGCGTVFKLTPHGTLIPLHSFDMSDGAGPLGAVLQATDGVFYGTTSGGGEFPCSRYGCGTVFSVDTGLGPFVAFVRNYGKVGQTGGILGQGFTGTTSVSLNGTPASFTVVSDTFIKATVPLGATTGFVKVVTPSGTLTSNVPFRVLP
jgi:uncharacterized repeat protein (TIGR03803 family)